MLSVVNETVRHTNIGPTSFGMALQSARKEIDGISPTPNDEIDARSVSRGRYFVPQPFNRHVPNDNSYTTTMF